MPGPFSQDLARLFGLPPERGGAILQQLSRVLQNQLKESGQVELEGFGILRINDNGSLSFEPDDSLKEAVNHRYSGLKPIITAMPVQSEEPAAVPVEDEEIVPPFISLEAIIDESEAEAPEAEELLASTKPLEANIEEDLEDIIEGVWTPAADIPPDPGMMLGEFEPFEEADFHVIASVDDSQVASRPDSEIIPEEANVPEDSDILPQQTDIEEDSDVVVTPSEESAKEVEPEEDEPQIFEEEDVIPPVVSPLDLSQSSLENDHAASIAEVPVVGPEIVKLQEEAQSPKIEATAEEHVAAARTYPTRRRSGIWPILFLFVLLVAALLVFAWLFDRSEDRTVILQETAEATEDVVPEAIDPTISEEELVAEEASPEPEPIVEIDPLRGTAPIDPALGGVTWVLYSEISQATAERRAATFQEQGFRTAVFPATVRGARRYRVVIGQFSSMQEAEAHRSELPGGLPSDIWISRL